MLKKVFQIIEYDSLIRKIICIILQSKNYMEAIKKRNKNTKNLNDEIKEINKKNKN